MLWKLSENSWISSDVNLFPSLVSYAPAQFLLNEAGLEAMELDQVLNNAVQESTSIFWPLTYSCGWMCIDLYGRMR